MPKRQIPVTLAETKRRMVEIRQAFEEMVAAGNPEAVAAKKRIDAANRKLERELRLPPGYEHRRIGH